jgi:hypothetical protein
METNEGKINRADTKYRKYTRLATGGNTQYLCASLTDAFDYLNHKPVAGVITRRIIFPQ